MKPKKILTILILLFFLVTMVGCSKDKDKKNQGDNSKQSNEQEKKDNNDKIKEVVIGLVTNESGINDKGFNQGADMGAKRAEQEFGVVYVPIETLKGKYKEGVQKVIESNANLIFGIGNEVADSIEELSKVHKDKDFVIVDNALEGENIGSVIFKQEEGSFLMGVIAGEMTTNNKIGFIGGKDISIINKYEAGFAAGVISVNPEAGKYLLNKNYVRYTDGFSDVSKAYEVGKSLYDSECDVIYHVCGESSTGLFQVAKDLSESGKDVWVIGSETDQGEKLPKFSDIILSSMVKRIDNAVYDTIKKQVEGESIGGSIVEVGLKEKGVSIATSTAKKVPKDILELVSKYENDIIEGKIKVPTTLEELKGFDMTNLE